MKTASLLTYMPISEPIAVSNMVKGIGCDLIEIKRFEEALARSGEAFLKRLFTQKEIDYCRTFADNLPHFAGRFAAKEALSKALGTGIGSHLSWHDMEILPDELGRPHVVWNVDIASKFSLNLTLISISHTEHYALAYAFIE
jgi:holo-[acyl-carrier protein] synthase